MSKKVGIVIGIAAVLVVAGVLVAAAVGVGAVLAQEPTQSAETPVATKEPAGPRGDHDMHGPVGGGRFWGGAPFDALAEALGMTVDEVRQALADGQTIADLAAAKGVALEDVAGALVAAQAERLQQAVDNGRLTQEDADAKIAQMEADILERLESGEPVGPLGPGGFDMPGGPRGGKFLGGAPFDALAEALGMTVDDLRQALADGQTIADLAAAKGVALEDVAGALVAAQAERLQQAVDNGRLTQEDADAKIAQMEANILEHLESGEPIGPLGPGGPGRCGGPGGMGGGPWGGGFRGPRNPDSGTPVPEG
jgi:uncharacterized protein (DUF433 family)